MIGVEELFGRDYVVQEERTVEDDGNGPFVFWFRFRQDETGLYAADIAANIPPILGRARNAPMPAGMPSQRSTLEERFATHPHRDAVLAAWDALNEKMALVRSLRGRVDGLAPEEGPLEGEITQLVYPLRRGAHWTIRPDPFFEATVEDLQRIRTPVASFWAWRVRIDNAFMRPNDEVLVWWSRVGPVATYIRLEGLVTDSDGNVLGRLIGTEKEFVTDFERGENVESGVRSD
jgi:hypothetical protein